ncbi:hypothetical protein SEA_KROMP_57 [Streptomyces phage Kromp]|uniref:Uncharacterized protein n=1 Tax=Streptomyces phage Kromp TaxID=2315619 RepID=A0A386K8H5_9CAUD|nr:hypothetical protein SEA_KROMP_57 [Streptomyces phage Kromp]
MTASLTPAPANTDQGQDDLVHVVCFCDQDTALCGTNVTGYDWPDDEASTCVVCRDLEHKPCNRCGA